MRLNTLAPILVAIGTAALAGCAPDTLPVRPDNATQAPSPSQLDPIEYRCENGVMANARYPDHDRAEVTYGQQTYHLRIAMSADGARYIGDGHEWWSKGSGAGATALFTNLEDDTIIARCEQVTERDPD